MVIAPPAGSVRPPFRFAADDEAFLNEVQHGAFNFLWNAASPTTGMVYDRTTDTVVSVAGVGFQLAALPVGVERGWVSRAAAEERALLILRTLRDNPSNRKAGLFYHFLNDTDGGPRFGRYEKVVSTVDSALLFSGVLTASSYFGGEVAQIGDALFADADWTFFQRAGDPAADAHAGFLSLGWKVDDEHDPTGDGQVLPYVWADSGDEHRLVTFLAVAAPDESHRVDPALYYRLRRSLGTYADLGPMVYFPYSGALFTAFFMHCFVDHAALGTDDPAAWGVEHRARVDWWENSRRLVNLHRVKARENPLGLRTLGEHAWGLTACDAPGEPGQPGSRYSVPDLFPDPLPMRGARDEWDRSPNIDTFKDDWDDGTVAPYGAGSSIMFEPEAAVAALRWQRALTRPDGRPLVWDATPPARGGFGFRDSFNLQDPDNPWAAPEWVAIDAGPMLLAIENARTGLVWDLFHAHPAVRAGWERLGQRREPPARPPAETDRAD